ncbi:MAG TPA: class I SAM-dependent methyltransferase, partial [Bdellovibrionales bacterium]|nr:class I SAM-dependent methyltransferase [Bdellovibrionales bacterium]
LALRWTAKERELEFEFRRDAGLSPGLFLDQRANRAFIEGESQKRKVLNLFCYTGGFSVAAAKGGAEKVVSVDVSKTFLEWTKRNFELNGLALEPHEFRAIDAREYLAWAKKKSLTFDRIICDPPSFGRSQAGVFKIEKDLDALVESLIAVTAPHGKILFSLNFEGWDRDEFVSRMQSAAAKFPQAKLSPTPAPDLDFEMPHSERNMKSVLITIR